jgi:hypothetical protein
MDVVTHTMKAIKKKEKKKEKEKLHFKPYSIGGVTN